MEIVLMIFIAAVVSIVVNIFMEFFWDYMDRRDR